MSAIGCLKTCCFGLALVDWMVGLPSQGNDRSFFFERVNLEQKLSRVQELCWCW